MHDEPISKASTAPSSISLRALAAQVASPGEQEGMMSNGEGTLDWDALASVALRPTKVLMIEALLWIDKPLLAVDLEEILSGTAKAPSISYHARSLSLPTGGTPTRKHRVGHA
jgi:hypothetical protein